MGIITTIGGYGFVIKEACEGKFFPLIAYALAQGVSAVHEAWKYNNG